MLVFETLLRNLALVVVLIAGCALLVFFLAPRTTDFLARLLIHLSYHQLRSKMRRSGRFLSWHAACERIRTEGGTLIVEIPTLGCGDVNLWWTRDDALVLNPFPPPPVSEMRPKERVRYVEWDRWWCENYTCAKNGKASLIGVWDGESAAAELKERFPDLMVARPWTGLLFLIEKAFDAESSDEM